MPCPVASARRVCPILAGLAASVVAVSTTAPAAAADPPAIIRGADRPHPDAAKINQANSRVIHAGPGTPLTGAIHVPPAQAKKEKKSD